VGIKLGTLADLLYFHYYHTLDVTMFDTRVVGGCAHIEHFVSGFCTCRPQGC